MLTNATEIQSIPPLAMEGQSGGQSPIIDQAERFLDILDEYQKKLGNPKVGLGEISPIVNEMAAHKESLTPVMESMADGDELKEILNRSLVTSSIEIYRFSKDIIIQAADCRFLPAAHTEKDGLSKEPVSDVVGATAPRLFPTRPVPHWFGKSITVP